MQKVYFFVIKKRMHDLNQSKPSLLEVKDLLPDMLT